MFIFLGGTIGAILFGRFYCGWLCPINTTIDGINNICKKNKIKRKQVPKWLKHPSIRYIILIIFIGIMIFTIKTGQKIPILAILVALGALLSMIFVPSLWHRYLCPYGVLLSITSSLAKIYWQVDQNVCNKCGMCKKVCPAEAINMEDKKSFPEISKAFCLQCLECVKVCPKNAISYRKNNKRVEFIEASEKL